MLEATVCDLSNQAVMLQKAARLPAGATAQQQVDCGRMELGVSHVKMDWA